MQAMPAPEPPEPLAPSGDPSPLNASVGPLRESLLAPRTTSESLEQTEQRPSVGVVVLTMLTMVINASNSAVFKHVQAQAPKYIFDCNVLCSTNLVGLLTLPLWFRRDLTPEKLKAVGWRRWLALLVGTLLFQVVGPFFFLKGLAGTSVAQAAVLARLDQVEFYAFALAFLGEKLVAWDAVANALTLLAVALTLTVGPLFGAPIALESSSILVIVSTFGYSGSLYVSKRFLTKVPIGIVSVFRLLVGTLGFHFYVLAVGGRDGLSRLFAPELWRYMSRRMVRGPCCWRHGTARRQGPRHRAYRMALGCSTHPGRSAWAAEKPDVRCRAAAVPESLRPARRDPKRPVALRV